MVGYAGLVKISIGKAMILSVPLELNNDHEELFSIASRSSSCISEIMMYEIYGWPGERFYRVINVLLKEGIVWLDSSFLDAEGNENCKCVNP